MLAVRVPADGPLAVAGLRPSQLPRTRNRAILLATGALPGFRSNVLTVGVKRFQYGKAVFVSDNEVGERGLFVADSLQLAEDAIHAGEEVVFSREGLQSLGQFRFHLLIEHEAEEIANRVEIVRRERHDGI